MLMSSNETTKETSLTRIPCASLLRGDASAMCSRPGGALVEEGSSLLWLTYLREEDVFEFMNILDTINSDHINKILRVERERFES